MISGGAATDWLDEGLEWQADEWRASVRYLVAETRVGNAEATTAPVTWVRARVQRIEKSGITLLVPRRFEPKNVLEIVLQPPALTLMRSKRARVLAVTPRGAHQWLLHCLFLNALSQTSY